MPVDRMKLVADLGEPRKNLRDRFMLDRGAAGPARRIAAENRFGNEGGNGEAGRADALVEFRPQLFRRAVGDRRFAFYLVLFRHSPSQTGDRAPAVASTVPRYRRHAAPPGVQGGLPPALIDGCPEGRADISLRSKPAPKR